MIRSALILLLLLPILLIRPDPATAQMSAAEFDAYTKGKTLFFGQNGQNYGVEEYFDNRRVRWSFLDGRCLDGFWYEDAGNICFLYENRSEAQCWSFELRNGGLIARFASDPTSQTLYEVTNSDEEMLCLGPEVGA